MYKMFIAFSSAKTIRIGTLAHPWLLLLCVRGVFWDSKNSRYRAQVGYQHKKIFMGYYPDPASAARAYDRKVVELHGAAGRQ